MITANAELASCVVNGRLAVRANPKASANRIRVETLADGSRLVRVDITVAPEDGKANAAIVKILAKALGLPKSAIEVVQGATSRNKVVAIQS